MTDAFPEFELPRGLDDVDAAFMTRVLRRSGVITATNEVVSQEEKGVGMTAGYFSEIKKVKCTYREPTGAPDSFVVKAWPSLELMPKDAIKAMFIKDIKAYLFPSERFYPRPRALLAAFDEPNDRWALVMEDADSFAEHKVHERELTMDEQMKMVPKLVDVAVAWEGCHEGEKAEQLADLAVDFWASDANLALYKAVMPGGAKLFDKFTTIEGSTVVGAPTWDAYLGGAGIGEMFTKKIDAFFERAHPARGATCTLAHGDLRGDNIFFCDSSAAYPDGWLCIDFQLLFRGPVPSDLAYLMGSGSVLPEVYTGDNLHRVLRSFYDQFMAKTQVYKAYTYEKFVHEGDAKYQHKIDQCGILLADNYGLAGREFIKYVLPRATMLRQILAQTQEMLSKKYAAKPAERFWMAFFASILVSGKITKKILKLHNYDVDAIVTRELDRIMETRAQFQSTASDPISTLGEFFNNNLTSLLRMNNGMPDLGAMSGMLHSIKIRLECEASKPMFAYVSIAAIRDYCRAKNIDNSWLRQGLLQDNVIVKDNVQYRLTSGSSLAAVNCRCWKIDMNNPKLSGLALEEPVVAK